MNERNGSYVRLRQQTQPLDRLVMLDNAVHAIHVQHNLAESWNAEMTHRNISKHPIYSFHGEGRIRFVAVSTELLSCL